MNSKISIPTKQKIPPQYYYRQFLHPKFWPTWTILITFRAISFLPHSIKFKLAEILGIIVYKLNPGRCKIARANIKLCFKDLTEKEQEELVKKSIIATTTGFIENTIAWWNDMTPYIEKLKIYGKEHIDEANKRGKGILLLGGHYSVIDFAIRLFTEVTPFNHMYRPHDNPLFNAFIERKRMRYSNRGFTKFELKEMMTFIKEGNLVWYGADQDFGLKYGVFAPFFNEPAATLTMPAAIARETGASVLHLSQFREGNGVYSLRFSPILEDFPSDDEIENASRINELIEKYIRIHPEQYMWVHRRFKTRPEGKNSIYK